MRRRTRTMTAGLIVAMGAATLAATPPAVAETTSATSDPVGSLPLLTDPYLQLPGDQDVHVVWNTEFPGEANVVLVGPAVAALDEAALTAAAAGDLPDGVTSVPATTAPYTRLAEDSDSFIAEEDKPAEGVIAPRSVWRHEALVTDLEPGTRTPYRVVSTSDGELAASGTFTLAPSPRPGDDLRILLTSDHQAMVNTPANLEMAAETIGRIDAVFFAGDLVNVPDRASEWFDDDRGGAFFPVLQGNAGRASTNGDVYVGGEIVQHAPLFPAVGNHEVQGRVDGATNLLRSFNHPVPRAVAEEAYEAVAAEVDPAGDPAVRDRWVEDNSFSTTSYEEVFTLPETSPGGETYYAVTVGDVRLVSLYSTRIWRAATAHPDPAERAVASRFQEAVSTLEEPLEQGYGEHVFEDLSVGSEQLDWLQEELASEEFTSARLRVVMLHEGPQTLGGNVMPHFAHPQRIEETADDGVVIGVRYEYPPEANMLLEDVQPLLEEAGVGLVHNGHNHVWNRFVSPNGVNYLETANTGNTYGAYHELSGRVRDVPPAPWVAENYLAVGNPGGLDPVVPTGAALTTEDGTPLPFVQSNDHAVFTVLETGSAEVVSYIYDVRTPRVAPVELDRFSIGAPHVEEPTTEEPTTETPTTDEPTTAGPTPPPTGEPTGPGSGDGDGDGDDSDNDEHRTPGGSVTAGDPPSGNLPRTGADGGLWLAAATLLALGLGGATLAVRRPLIR